VAPLHPLVSGFSADVYERGRPTHGREVTEVLAAELDLNIAPPARVLDLGAGTGKLSQALLAAGFDVVSVEPLEDMRAVLAAAIGDDRALAGTAEAVPLPDDSVDAITISDAFHWFDQRAAIAEIRRVLRPGGGVAVLWTAPSWHGEGFEWAHELGEMVAPLRARHPMTSARGPDEAFADAGGFAPVRNVGADAERESDRDAVLAYIASWSWVGALPEAERSGVLEDAEALLRRHGFTHARHAVHTDMYLTRLIEPAPAPAGDPPAAAS
jgi:SAM-dependent methyltransferase